jgi:IS5 family transposase
VLRTKVDPQPTLWEAMLPEAFRRLPPGRCAIDRLLDDPVSFEPFAPYFDPYYGRPSIPIETYLRLMHVKVPLPPRLREPVRGGDRLAQLAAVLSHRAL